MYTPIDDLPAIPHSAVEEDGNPADSAHGFISPGATFPKLRTTLTEDEILTPRDFFKQDGHVLRESMERALGSGGVYEVRHLTVFRSESVAH